MIPILVLRSAVSLAQRAVRRWLISPQPADRTPSLTIGAVHMSEKPEIPPLLDLRTSRRSLAYQAVLNAAEQLILARFALARALDKLTTEQILSVLDEVDQTAEINSRPLGRPKTTLRDEN